MAPSREELRSSMAAKAHDELYAIVYTRPQDWTDEAVGAARDELNARGIESARLNEIATAAEAIAEKELLPLRWSMRMLSFFICTFGLGLPGLLVYRRYLERGEVRRGRVWAAWAWRGLFFYLGIGVILAFAARA